MRRFLPALLALAFLLIPSRVHAERHLYPGDRLRLECDQYPLLCVERTVGIDGAIDLPEVGAVGIGTKAILAAAQKLSLACEARGFVPAPEFRLSLLSPRGNVINVAGAVGRPFEGTVTPGTLLADAVQAAAPADDADLASVSVESLDGTLTVWDVAGKSLLLTTGDRVYVPRLKGGSGIIVTGGVVQPGAVNFSRGLTLSRALEQAGGVAAHGDAQKIVLTRRGEAVPVQMPDDAGLQLQPGEAVFVSLRAERKFVSVAGDVERPGPVDYAPGMTVMQAIASAGGIKKGIRPDTVTVRTVFGRDTRTTRLSFEFLRLRRIPDPVLKADDAVEISRKGKAEH